jgi:RNA polymerase sigma-70 factor (ECF subfamily)
MAQPRGFSVEVDELVVARARRGDRQALTQLYSLFAGPVYTLGCRLTGAADVGEEILQETFLELLRSISSYRGDGHIGSWVRRIAVSKFLMRVRRSRSRPDECGGALTESFELPRSPPPDGSWRTGLDVERALARLPEATRAVVWLHDVEGLTHTEIARLFGRSESFSKSQLARGRDRLRRWLDPERNTDHASDDTRAVGAAGR